MHELNVIKPRERISDLTPGQIEKLRKAIPQFDLAWSSVKNADQNAERMRRELRADQVRQ